MSQENVEIVRRVNEAFDKRDIEGYLAEHHPDAEVVVLRSQIVGPFRNHEGIRRMLTEAFTTAPDFEVEIDEVRECGNGRVLVLGRQRATVRGVPFDRVLAEVYRIEAGKIARMEAFPTIELALEAVGLSE